MTALRQSLADYLRVRRALGAKLDRAEKLLTQFLVYLEQHNADVVTVELRGDPPTGVAFVVGVFDCHLPPFLEVLEQSGLDGGCDMGVRLADFVGHEMAESEVLAASGTTSAIILVATPSHRGRSPPGRPRWSRK